MRSIKRFMCLQRLFGCIFYTTPLRLVTVRLESGTSLCRPPSQPSAVFHSGRNIFSFFLSSFFLLFSFFFFQVCFFGLVIMENSQLQPIFNSSCSQWFLFEWWIGFLQPLGSISKVKGNVFTTPHPPLPRHRARLHK